MTDDEYKVFLARLQNMFPEIARFLQSLEPLEFQAMTRRYRACLQSTPLPLANDVLDDFATQAESPWGGYGDKERAAAIIAKEVSRRESAAKDHQANRLTIIRGRPKANIETGIFGRILKAIEADERHDDACNQHRSEKGRCRRGCPVPRMIARELLADEDLPTTDEPPICKHCPGSGVASCLYPECFTREFLAGGPLERIRTYSTACHCSEGVKKQSQTLSSNRDVAALRPLDFKMDVWMHGQTEHEIRVMARALVESCGGKREAIFDRMNANGGKAQ